MSINQTMETSEASINNVNDYNCPPVTDDDIVISGIAGRFPESEDIEEFWSKLVNGVELTSANDSRWPVGYLGLPPLTGKMQNIDKFDSHFFGFNDYEANVMDAQIRLLHEVVYESIVDAGHMPHTFRGSNTAIFLGACYNDCAIALRENDCDPESFYQLSVSHVCETFDLRGPSLVVDTACASSFSATVQAVLGLRKNEFDTCIVAGSALQLKPSYAVAFKQLSMISPDGRSKCMDAGANGYCRSESCIAMLLQKRRNARRIYAEIVACETNTDGYKPEGITYPSYELQKQLLKRTYRMSRVDPSRINYVEAHMTGTAAGDPTESRAILDTIRENSDKPLRFGCLKSNMGHAEGASGVAAITKAALIFQHRLIPPNINYKSPNPNIEGLIKGQIVPNTCRTPFHENWISCNSFGFGGVNVHTILRANAKSLSPKSYEIQPDGLPRLINACGRTKESVTRIYKLLTSRKEKLTTDFLTLLNEVSKIPVDTGIPHRGYCLISDNEMTQGTVKCLNEKRPLWLLFTSFGCNALSVDVKQLQKLHVWKESFEKSVAYVEKLHGLKLTTSITDDPIGRILWLVSYQIALFDLIEFLDLKPDGIIGHSLGEIATGYGNRTITREEALSLAYFTAKTCYEAQKESPGLMAVVDNVHLNGFSPPPGVTVSENIGQNSLLVSGPKDAVMSFVDHLKNNFSIASARLKESEIAFHSDHIAGASEALSTRLSKVFSNTKKQEQLTAFYTRLATQPLHFEESLAKVSKNATVVMIGGDDTLSSGHLKAALELETEVIDLQLTTSDERQLDKLLVGLGSIYATGQNPSIEKLYPKVEYPVSRETDSLSNFIRWEHSRSWLVTRYPDYFNTFSKQRNFSIDVEDPSWRFVAGHCIDGRNLFPATGYLYIVWEALSSHLGNKHFDEISVEFRNVKLHRATIVPKSGSVHLIVTVKWSSGEFCITEGGTVCATGFIKQRSADEEPNTNDNEKTDQTDLVLSTGEIYKELRVRGYDYGPSFQGLKEASADGTFGTIKWLGHWVTFADCMMQLACFAIDKRSLYIPTAIEYLSCDVKLFYDALQAAQPDQLLTVHFEPVTNIVHSAGLYMKGLKASPVARRQNTQVARIESLDFRPYEGMTPITPVENKTAENYDQLCTKILDNIEQECPKMSNGLDLETIDDLLNSENKQHSLLKALRSIIEQETAIDTWKHLDEQILELSHDMLVTLTSYRVIRHHLDIVIENTARRTLNIGVIGTTNNLLHDLLFEILDFYSLNATYTALIAPGVKNPPSSIKTFPFDDETYKITSDVKNLEFLIYKDYSSTLMVSGANKQLQWSLFLQNANSSLKEGGFALLMFRNQLTTLENRILKLRGFDCPVLTKTETVKQAAESAGFVVISQQLDPFLGVSLLLRKQTPVDLEEQHAVIKIDHGRFEWVNELKKEILNAENKRIWLTSVGSDVSGMVGMVNCLRRELRGDRIRCIVHTEPVSSDDNTLLTEEILKKDLVMNIFKNGAFGSYRYTRLDTSVSETRDTEYAYVDIRNKGDLSSFSWFESSTKFFKSIPSETLSAGEYSIDLYYSALNFKDVMVASGRIPLDAYPASFQRACLIGMEWSGITQDGQRIMGFCETEGIASKFVATRDTFTISVPDWMTLEEASTIPVVYTTVYYALLVRGRLQPREKVLIHAGTGGIGQAAISVCLAMGCDVYTTVGTKEKREYIKKLFPALADHNIADSRSTDFEEQILHETGGKGVDIVLNSLAEEKLSAGLRCLSKFGRFIEIGKYDIVQDNPVDIAHFGANQSFQSVCIAHLLHQAIVSKENRARRIYEGLKDLLVKGMNTGAVRPLERCLFDKSDIEGAFRYMAAGKHVGKVVIKIREEKEAKTGPLKVKALAQTWFHPLKTQIICGGLGGFGLELTYWMQKRGATKFVLTSRTGIKKPYQQMVVNNLRKAGATVLVLVNEAATPESALELVQKASQLGPVESIFNLAMVLKDSVIENQSEELFSAICKPKIDVTSQLDIISRSHCPDLQYFVVFSSVAAGRGNAGQTNYGYANSSIDRLCEKRRKEGLHALSIQWGAVGDVGTVAEALGGNDVVIGGTMPQRIPSCMDVLNRLLQSSYAVCSSTVSAGNERVKGISEVDIVKSVCHVLGVKDPDPRSTLGDLGMDSLMCVEIKQGLERDYETVLSTQELRLLRIKDLQEIGNRKKSQRSSSGQGQVGDEKEKSESSLQQALTLTCPKEVFTQLNTSTTGQPVFFLPAVEGNFALLEPLAKHIIRPVIGLNWVEELDSKMSIKEIASFYVNQIRQTYVYTEYDLVGYSFGGLIALEVASQLQVQFGKHIVRNLILLDTSPAHMKAASKQLASKKEVVNEETGHVETLISFVSLFAPISNLDELRQQLLPMKKEERLVTLSKLMTAQSLPAEPDVLAKAADRYYQKIWLASLYEPEIKYEGDLKLIRASEKFSKYLSVSGDNDYGLSNDVNGKCEVVLMNGDHRSFLTDNYAEIGSFMDTLFMAMAFA